MPEPSEAQHQDSTYPHTSNARSQSRRGLPSPKDLCIPDFRPNVGDFEHAPAQSYVVY